MPIYQLNESIVFPPVEGAEDGIVAVGGELSAERLMLAYRSGIFPWYSEEEPIIWWSPDPRFVLYPDKIKVTKRMKSILRKGAFVTTYNKDFEQVIGNCQKIYRKDQPGTWITEEMKNSYIDLHKKGLAKSIEVWQEDKLVGGMYGVDLGDVFCGESMFSKVSNASKVALINFAQKFGNEGGKLIDCQVHTPHLESLGGENISRNKFLEYLQLPFE
jgi:leucyl/phenylalanyl-tRNA--protein transferase